MSNTVNPNIASIYPLTPLQEGMLFHKLLDENSKSYFEQSVIKFSGDLDIETARTALNLVALKHEVLRAVIIYKNVNKPRQIILKERNLEVNLKDISEVPDKENVFLEIKNADIDRGFDFSKDTLMRVTFVKIGYKEYRMIWSFHHIIIDGWCLSIVLGDFMSNYRQLVSGKSVQSIRKEIEEHRKSNTSFGQYVKWLEGKDKAEGLKYWENLLSDCDEVSEILPLGQIDVIKPHEGTVAIQTGEELYKKLQKLSQMSNTTLNVVVEAALGILLQRYSRNSTSAFGKIVSGRNAELAGINDTVGLFINSIPVKVSVDDDTTVQNLIKSMQQQSIESGNYDYCSLAEIQSRTSLGMDLIKVLFVFENYYVNEDSLEQGMDDISIEMESAREETNYDITVLANSGETLGLKVMYNPARYSLDEIQLLLEKMEIILEEMAGNPGQKVKDICAVTQYETNKIQNEFNYTWSEYPREKTISQLFEEQVERTPDNIAVVFEDKQITYRELNNRANRLASKLVELGVKPNDFVGIMTGRCIEMIIGIYGIIKAGGAYVPIDPAYPSDRIGFMLDDCKPKAILLGNAELHFETNIPVINLLDMDDDRSTCQNPETVNSPDDIVYLIYTSGTTGNPKGVMNRQKGVINLIMWMQAEYPLGESDAILQKTTYTFDVSVSEILWWNFVGAKVVMLEQGGEKEPGQICSSIKDNNVTVINFVPSMLNMFLMHISERAQDLEKIKSLRYVFAAGEALNVNTVENFNRIMGKSGGTTRLVNLYGPTEASIYASYFNCGDNHKIIPIGKPIANTQLYILDGLKLCGIGMPGELCIAGDGVAAGYLNRQGLTAEKFIDNPFGEGKLYRTGDLTKWLPDGNIEYMGRIDHQVKVRGFRIELGEIESVLRGCPGIKDAAVIVREDSSGEKTIYAYMVSDQKADVERIREDMHKKLPEYMIPAYFMQIGGIPVNRNGKLDRKALPEIEAASTKQYVAPRNETEEKLVRIFESVLGVEKVGVNDSFFELGGHSLRATRVMNQIEVETGVRLPLKEIFITPTAAGLGTAIGKTLGEVYIPIPKAEYKEYYPMSSAQKRLFMVNEIDDTGIAYNMPANLELSGTLDADRIKDVFRQLIERHEALRTSFHLYDGESVQRIEPHLEAHVECMEGTDDSLNRLYGEFVRPFDLGKAPLMRIAVVKLADDRNVLFFDMHHIISDGVSVNIVIQEFTRLYNGEKLEPLSVQYKDYSEWMRTRDISSQKNYWTGQFSDEIPVLDLPLDYTRPQMQSFNGNNMAVFINKELKERVINLANKTGATEYMVLLGSLMVLLCKYSRQEDIVIGSPISGRTHNDTESMLGMFVNTLVMRGRPANGKKCIDFLREVKETCLKAYENQEYPFEELVEEVAVGREMSRNPIFDVMFSMQNTDAVSEIGFNDVSVSGAVESENTVAKFDLSVDISAIDDGYAVIFEYCTDLFKEESIQNMMGHYIEVVSQIMLFPDKMIGEIETVSLEEKQKILVDFNNTHADYVLDRTIVELFEEQVQKTPDSVAVVFEDDKITYSKLNEKANGLAVKLRALGVKPDDFVAIIPQRSIQMIIGIFGIIKAGGAYVPIDPSYPESRIQYILDDCKAKALILVGEQAPSGTGIPVINLPGLNSLPDYNCLEGLHENPVRVNKPQDLAYVIYTSGTTGKPKGVMIEHRNLVNLVHAYSDVYNLTCSDTVLQFASIAFDQSVWDIFNILTAGGTLCLMPYHLIGNTRQLEDYIAQKGVTVVALTPAFLRELDETRLPQLRVVESGGAAAEADVLERWRKSGKVIFNTYGPTEATVNAISYQLCHELAHTLPIGKPVPNVKAYVLNGNNLCGIGMPGELCIAGAGVARGYLNQPALTKQKFIDNPFGEGKLYRSGDLARWLPDGNIEYLGRVDEQVKVRGFRIELGEVENVLRKQDGIKDCTAMVRKDNRGDNCICAYITGNHVLDIDNIRAGMGRELPDYMIPAYFMQIDSIPLTSNGKVDRKALPEIHASSTKEYAAPRNATEEMLVKIFEDVLGIDKVGVNDSFFELGGHSLRATRVINRIEMETGVRLPLKEIFLSPTAAGLSIAVGNASGEKYIPIPKAGLNEFYPMSSAQKRLFMISGIDDTGIAYNMPANLELSGKLDIQKIKDVFRKLIERHEALRTTFHMHQGEPVQCIAQSAEAEVGYIESTEDELKGLYDQFVRRFELDKAPLMRLMVVKLADDRNVLFFDMHHIISDGMSIDIITSEFTRLYNGEELEPLSTQYKDYSEWMRTRDISRQKKYWVEQFSDEIPVLDLPLDYPRPQTQSFNGKMLTVFIGREQKERVAELARDAGATEYMVLLSSLMVLLSKYSRQEDIVVGSPVSGRTHKDTESIVGMFVNTLAMRGKPESSKSCMDFLKEIKESCLRAYENQEYPFEELLEAVEVRRDMSRNPLFDVMFVLQNTENVELAFNDINISGEVEHDYSISKFDLTVNIAAGEEGYEVSFEYCTDLFLEESIQAMMEHYVQILDAAAMYPDRKIGEIEAVTASEKQKILIDFNDTTTDYPRNKTVVQLFEEQVEKTPDNVAVVSGEEKITYAQLDKKANQLALKLRELGVKPDDFVAIVTERSIGMVAGILGIIKAGGAYVPVDTNFPAERIRFMLEDCQPKVILTGKTPLPLETAIPELNLFDENTYTGEDTSLERVNTPNNLIYLIYTSGTTGKPKGAMIEHRNVVRLVRNTNFVNLDESTVILQTGAMSFDASTFEVWGTLLNGGKLCFVPNDVLADPAALKWAIESLKVNTMWFTSTLYNQMISSDCTLFDSLKQLLIGGEKLSDSHVRMLKDRNAGISLINGYGPTESTTFTTTFEIPQDFRMIPIGKPIANTKVYILQGTSLCGIGMPGELCAAGDGLTRGYLNRPELNQEKFIKNPFGEGKLYRTGDLARWLPDGNIEYLGRMDEQVKIRGFRIELGEIESVMAKFPEIKDVVVVVKEANTGEKAICAYFTGQDNIDIDGLKEKMHKELPDYCMPAYFMHIDSIPVTRNGKVDKRALPDIEVTSTQEYVAPRNKTEQEVAKIFENVLCLNNISVFDSFFELGGDSIKAIRLVSKMKEAGYNIKIKDVMLHKTIEQISKKATVLTVQEGQVYRDIEITSAAINITGNDSTPIPADQNIIYRELEKYNMNIDKAGVKRKIPPESRHKHFLQYQNGAIYFALDLKGDYTEDILFTALKKVIIEQSVLRTVYDKNENLFIELNGINEWYIPYIDLTLSDEKFTNSHELCLKMNAEPLIYESGKLQSRMLVMKTSGTTHRIYLWVHHSLWDNVSSTVFEKRLASYLKNPMMDISRTVSYFDGYSEGFIKEYGELLDNPVVAGFNRAVNNCRRFIKTDNVSAALFNIRFNDTDTTEFSENPFAWLMKTASIGWSFNDGFGQGDVTEMPILLYHNARNDENLDSLGLYLDVFPVVYDFKDPDSIIKQIDALRNSKDIKNGMLYNLILDLYPGFEIPAVDMNIVEVFDVPDEQIMTDKPRLVSDSGQKAGAVMHIRHNRSMALIEMSFHPDKKDAVVELIGKDYILIN